MGCSGERGRIGETGDFSGRAADRPGGRAAGQSLPARGMTYSAAMRGLHLTADLYRCRCEAAWLADAGQLGAWCLAAVGTVGLTPASHLFHGFADGGVGASILLAHSHVHLRTWPHERAVSIDVYVSNRQDDHSAKARGLMEALVSRFQPEWTEQRSMDRGEDE